MLNAFLSSEIDVKKEFKIQIVILNDVGEVVDVFKGGKKINGC